MVVMSNSLGSNVTIWDKIGAGLAANYRTLNYELRGHGNSSSVPGDYTVEMLADDLTAVLVHEGIQAFHLVGVSLGGMIAQHIGIAAKLRVLSLTLLATASETPAGVWEPRLELLKREGLTPLVEPTLSRWFAPSTRARDPGLINEARLMIGATSVEGYAGCAAAVRDFHSTQELRRITAPTLLVAGEKDQSTPPSALEAIRQRIAGSQIVILPDAAHLLPLERPSEVAGLIRGFVGRVQ